MDFLKKKLSMSTDPDKDEEETTSSTLFESLSTKRATLWNDFTSKIKSDKSTPDNRSESDITSSSTPTVTGTSGSFMESVKQRLQSVRLYENGHTAKEKDSGEPECAPLIDTADGSSAGGDSDIAICGESATSELPINNNEIDIVPPATQRKKLSKRQDSFTAEEVYLDTVASQVRNGLVQPDCETTIVSPSKAVQEFAFAESSGKTNSQPAKKNSKATSNSLTVANSNLINFDSVQNLSQAASSRAETVVHREDDGVFDYESSGDESSEPVYTEFASRRSNSLNSINSIESAFEDPESLELKQFAEKFVGNIFSDNSNSNEDKARFGKCVQDGNFRLHFARAISEKRGNRKAVSEHTFYQLVQYFAVVLFECDEADDFTPATVLMNMCFTFYYEASRAGKIEKNFLSSYLKNQPIWQSMRYWNAAFYESVQTERERKPLTTNNSIGGSNHTTTSNSSELSQSDNGKDDAEEEDQDRRFQRNIIFGQLGTFLYNMRAFGLNMEWCSEFLRKQSTIGNLTDEHIQMLRESIESLNEV